MRDNAKFLSEMIKDAEMILIGIGTEFSNKYTEIENTKFYKKIANDLGTDDIKNTKFFPYVIYEYLQSDNSDKILQGYHLLASTLKDKNYFFITTNIDDIIWQSDINFDRIVAPCGGYHHLQCSNGCKMELINCKPVCVEFIEQIRNSDNCNNILFPTCSICGSELVFNNVFADKYIEEEYLSQWKKYTLWLQGTLNKRVCILELGVGMSYPSVIRWPFEKIGFYNNKASFFRVNEKLFQLSEELKEKGISIPENALDFIVNKFV